jgi:hypothetical protein
MYLAYVDECRASQPPSDVARKNNMFSRVFEVPYKDAKVRRPQDTIPWPATNDEWSALSIDVVRTEELSTLEHRHSPRHITPDVRLHEPIMKPSYQDVQQL